MLGLTLHLTVMMEIIITSVTPTTNLAGGKSILAALILSIKSKSGIDLDKNLAPLTSKSKCLPLAHLAVNKLRLLQVTTVRQVGHRLMTSQPLVRDTSGFL